MATPGAYGGQLGWKSESTYGTGVTVDTFHPGYLTESITQDIERIESQGIRAGRLTNHAWVEGRKTVGGSVDLELWDEPLATLLTHMFGTVNTTGGGPYTHTASPGDLSDNSFTLELGRPSIDGTSRSFVYAGCKIPSWSLSCSVGDIPTLSLDVSAQSEATGGSLASASYSTATPFVFTGASVSAGGSEVTTVSSVDLSANNMLATDRHFLNSATIAEQLDMGVRPFTGSFSADFEDLTLYNYFVNGTENALVLAFDNGTDSLTITCNVRYDGSTPTTPNEGLLEQPIDFVCTSTSSDASAITAVLINGESSAA